MSWVYFLFLFPGGDLHFISVYFFMESGFSGRWVALSPTLLFCVVAVEWSLIWAPGGSIQDLFYTVGKLLYRSVILEIIENYLTCYPRILEKTRWLLGFLCCGELLLFISFPLEGIQVHLLGSLLLLELFDYSRNFHCSRPYIDSTN